MSCPSLFKAEFSLCKGFGHVSRRQIMRVKATRGESSSPRLQIKEFVLFSASLTKLFVNPSCQSHLGRVALIRPLIPVNRADLNKLCRCWRLPIYPDITNTDMSSPRNRIRQDLLPVLRQMFNQNLDNVLWQSAEIFSADQLYIDLVVSKLSKTAEAWQGGGDIQLRPLPLAIKRALLRRCLQAGTPQRGRLSFLSLELLLQEESKGA